MTKLFFIFVFLLPIQLFGQGVQDHALSSNEISHIERHFEQLLSNIEDGNHLQKCLTSDVLSFKEHQHQLSPKLQSQLTPYLSSEIQNSQATYLSENGWFIIEYDTTGTHALLEKDDDENGINDLVERAAEYAEHSWRLQVETWGFRNPLVADTPYRISFRRLSPRFYGVTNISGNSSYIEINPRLDIVIDGAPNTDPEDQVLGALKVTVAHELKHAIQIVYGSQARQKTFPWWEMDATLMEEVVYDEVNDYYNYLPSSSSLFRNPQRGLATGGLYFHASFSLFFVEYYGIDFWVSVWEKIGNGNEFIPAILDEIKQRGDDPAYISTLLYEWHYLSGSRSKEGIGFKDAAFYPDLSVAFSSNQGQNSFTQPVAAPWQARELSTFAAYIYETTTPTLQDEPKQLSLYSNGTSLGVSILSTSTEVPLAERFTVPSKDTLMFVTTESSFPRNEPVTVIAASAHSSFQTNSLISTLLRPSSALPSLRYGDGNLDGLIDDRDYETLLGYALAIEDRDFFPPLIHLPFDLSGDGTISAYDAALLLDAIHTSSSLPRDENEDALFPESSWFDLGRLPKIQSSPLNDPLTFSLAPENTEMDAMLSIRLDTNGGNTLRSGIMNVYYDQDSLTFVGAQWKAQSGEAIMSMEKVQTNVQQGFVRIAFASSEPIQESAFLECTFNERGDLDLQKSTFVLEAIQLNEFALSTFPTDTLTTSIPTGVGVSQEPLPTITSFELESNYPNPFNPSTTIAFSLPSRGTVELSVFSLQGQKIATLAQGPYPAGRHEVRWDASRFASGMYIYEWKVSTAEGEFRRSKKMVYLK